MLQFDAEINLFASDQAGRTAPVRNEYRGMVHVGDLYTTGVFHFAEDRWIRPGESIRANVALVSGDEFLAALPRDKRFELTEGRHVVGRGRLVGDPVSTPPARQCALTRS